MPAIRVLVFGSTGSGKTSLCNALAPHKMPANDSAVGVTFQSFVFPPFEVAGQTLILTDTVGLNESDKGTVSSTSSIQQLIALIKNSKEGYNLLVHVMRAPRITKSHSDNYEFFVKTLTQEKIPCILVVTGCENSDPMSVWVESNKAAFTGQGLVYKDMVATCFAAGGRLEPSYANLRLQSSAEVFKSITRHSASSPVLLFDDDRGFLSTVKRAWNWFCGWLGTPEWQIVVDEGLFNFLIRVGIAEATAKILASGIRRGG